MALVTTFEKLPMKQNRAHDTVSATYSVFREDGRTYLQLDTYGRESREMRGKKSQTIQLDEAGARCLFGILKREFGL